MPFSITPAATNVNENVGSVTFTVSRTSATTTETVYFSTILNGGINSADYTPIVDRALTFAPGVFSQPVTVFITPDTEVEPDQTFGVIIQQTPNPNPNIFLARSFFTIVNDDVPSTPAEITVLGNGANIVDGDTTPLSTDHTDFGVVVVGGAPIVRTFTVRNDGGSTLTLGTPTLPAGFTLAEPLAGSLAPGASDTFQVRLDTASAGTRSGQISFTSNDSDEATFNFSITGSVGAPPPGDDFAANTSTLGQIAPGQTRNGNLETAGDADWFSIAMVAGTTYTIKLNGSSVGAGTLEDPFVYLHNSAGVVLTSNDDGGGNLNSLLTYTPTASGTYFISAREYGDNNTGTYQLNVTASTPWLRPVGLQQYPLAGTPVVTQGYGGDTSHNNQVYSIDFQASSNTNVLTVAGGTVVGVRTGSTGIDTSFGGYGNYVTILHEGGFYATYAHLSAVGVSVGQTVVSGMAIGQSGATGGFDRDMGGPLPAEGYPAHLHITFGTSLFADVGDTDRADGSGSTGSPAFFLDFFQSPGELANGVNPADSQSLLPTDIFGTANATDPDTDDDELVGGNANNRILAGSGNDRLNGAGGNDLLVGGSGLDSFVFNSAPGASNVDTIADFSVTDDTIWLENAIFTALGGTGTLTAGAFNMGAAATQADDRVIYNSATGALFYDANGNGAGGAIQFATVSTGLALTHFDFLVI